jgi:hypothetical protein
MPDLSGLHRRIASADCSSLLKLVSTLLAFKFNFLYRYKEAGVKNYLVIAMDDDIAATMEKLDVPCWWGCTG